MNSGPLDGGASLPTLNLTVNVGAGTPIGDAIFSRAYFAYKRFEDPHAALIRAHPELADANKTPWLRRCWKRLVERPVVARKLPLMSNTHQKGGIDASEGKCRVER